MQVTSASFSADAGLFYVILVDEENDTVLPAVLVSASDGVYPYTIADVPPGQYRVFAGTDADDDEFLCDAGESCGAYPTLDAPTLLSINDNTQGLDFESVFRVNLSNNRINTTEHPAGNGLNIVSKAAQ